MSDEVGAVISDENILKRYPLPIAHEYKQLVELRGGRWRERCLQLTDVLDFSLRYCALIALGDYYGGDLVEGDPVLDQFVVRQLIAPSLQDLWELLRRVMAVYHGRHDILAMPDLYKFCYDAEGELRPQMRLVERLILQFALPLADPKRVSPSDEAQHQELYEAYEPQVKGLLAALSFVENYQLLRVFDAQPRGGGSVWRVKVLMGSEARREVEQWEMLAPPGRLGVALWDPGRQHLLPLHPFALFEHCPECSKELYSPPEELFLYQQTKEGQLVYLGLRESLGLTHRMPTREYVDALRILLRVPSWPPGVEVVVGPTPMRPLDWLGIRALAATRSKNLVASYGKEKYQRQVYLQRAEADGHYQAFLQSDRAGFLVVGDSGTGKTNLLCHWVEEALRSQDIVLFYNCADVSTGEGFNLGRVVAEHLGQGIDFGALLQRLDEEQAGTQGRFIVFLDALNEHRAPQVLLKSLCEDVLLRLPEGRYGWFKVVVSCRSEAWARLERYFTALGQFYETADGVEVRLTGFKAEELPVAYGKYQQLYDLKTAFGELSEVGRRLVVDPLMMKFVAESYRGQVVPGNVETSKVFDLYRKEKVGDRDDPAIDRVEKRIVQRLVERMYEEKRDEVAARSLWGEPEIGQAVLARESVSSPYFRLLDKGVLTEHQVGGYGAAALWEEAETRVRFTYDRFFECLLAGYLMPREVTVARVKELIEEADKHNFSSLWGAVKARLFAYAEIGRTPFGKQGLLAALAQEEGHVIRGLMVDTLTTYGSSSPESIKGFLLDALLELQAESAGLVAVFVGYQLKAPEVFERAFHYPSSVVRQVAIQHTYFYWSRYRVQGERFLDELTAKASSEVKSVVLREAFRKLAGEDMDLSRLPTLSALLGTTFLLSGHLLTEPKAVKRFAQNLVDFYNDFGLAKGIVVAMVKRWVGDATLEGFRGGNVMDLDTHAIFFRRPLGDVRRKEVRELAPCMGSEPRPVEEIANKLFEWSQIVDGVISTVLAGILINRSIYEPEATLALLKRMFYEGNTISRFNVLRAMESTLQREINPCPGYLEFFNEAVLAIWAGTEPTIEIEGRRYHFSFLEWPLAFECQRKMHGKIEFVDRLLALPWDGDKLSRLTKIIDNLGIVSFLAFRMVAVKPYPLLETLSQWFHLEELNSGERERVEAALAQALARIWRAYPTEVEHFLENEPDLSRFKNSGGA